MSVGATLDIWTLYDGPPNHTKRWVVRLFHTDKPTDTFFESNSRDACEAFVRERHPGAFWLERHPDDDPKIAGTWL